MAWGRWVLVTFALLLLPAAAPERGLAQPDDSPAGQNLTGQLLIATPDMRDPRFDHAVILIVRHNKGGAFGIVVNRPVAREKLARLLEDLGQSTKGIDGSIDIYAGGPVEPDIGFVLHDAAYHRPETVAIGEALAMTSSPAVLRDIAQHHGPAKFIFAFGYAGWGPGQLEDELAQHAWFTAPADPQLLFDDAPARLWQDAIARRSRAL